MSRPMRKAQNFTLEDSNNSTIAKNGGILTPIAGSNTRIVDNSSPYQFLDAPNNNGRQTVLKEDNATERAKNRIQ